MFMHGKTGSAVAQTLLNASIVGPGNAVVPTDVNRTFQITFSSGATGSVNIEASNDGGNNWVNLTTATASGGYVDNAPWVAVRANLTAISGGSCTVTMGS